MMASPMNAANGPFIGVSQWTNPPLTPVPQTPAFYQVLLKGQPKALGTTQIVLAFFNIALGSVLFSNSYGIPSITVYSFICYWGAFFYIISGSLAVASENNQSRSVIGGSLGMNIISSVTSFASLGLLIGDIPYFSFDYYSYYHCRDYSGNYHHECIIFQDTVLAVKFTTLSFLIIATLLQFCVSISVSAFGCRSLSRKETVPPQVFMIPNDYRNPGMNAAAPLAFGNPNMYSLPQRNEAQGVANSSNFMNSATQPQWTSNPTLPQANQRAIASLYPSYNTAQ